MLWSGVGGLPALFLCSFLAATVLPLGSEWLLASLLVGGAEPVGAVSVATAGNLLGAVSTWLLGWYGGEWLVRRVLRIDAADRQRAEAVYARYGSWSLLLSWLPVIGDPLCLAAGAFKVGLGRFLLLAGAGKCGRYALLAWATGQIAGS